MLLVLSIGLSSIVPGADRISAGVQSEAGATAKHLHRKQTRGGGR